MGRLRSFSGVFAGATLLVLSGCRADACPTGSVRLSDDLCHLLPGFDRPSESGAEEHAPLEDSAAPQSDDDACTPDHSTADDALSMVHAVPLDEDPFAHVLDLRYRAVDHTLFAAGEGGLMTFDVRTPTAPVLLSHVVTDETTRLHLLSLGVGTRVYTVSLDHGLYVWDTTDRAAPVLVEHLESDAIRALAADDTHVVTAMASGELVVYDALGERAPDFELVDLDGIPRRLSDAAGRPVVLMFFATWCPACVPELIEVEARLWPEWGARGVEFWAIGSENEVEDLQRFTEELELTFPILPDPSQEVFTAFELPEGPGLYPREWLIDSTGHVAYVTNRFEPDALEAALAADPSMADD